MIDLLFRSCAKSLVPLALSVLMLAAAGTAPTARAQDTLRAVAVVNDDVISMLDLVMRVRLTILSSGMDMTDQAQLRIQHEVLRRLIDEQLRLQEADRIGIAVSDEEVVDVIESISRRNGMSLPQFRDMLMQNQILPTAMEDRVRAELAWQQVVRVLLVPTIDIGDEEIDEIASRIKAGQGSPEVNLAEIFLEVENVLAEDETQRSVERLLVQLSNGVDFAALASEFSQSATASVGGDMGWIQEAQLPEELTAAVRKMQPGQIVGPVRGFSGFHILYLKDRRQVVTGDITVNLKQVYLEAPPDPTEQQIEELTLKAAGLRELIGSCADVGKIAAESGSIGSGDLGNVKLADLPGNLRQVVESLPLERPSEPLRVAGGIAVLVVCDRQGDQVNRDRIRDNLLAQRAEMLSRRKLHDLRRAANVDVRL
ncbi:MAG: peptidylprolyl isomerase [Planctomycetota bacterium]|jgi:peptidyl-prolyl cis-trans isomerase SurA